jgi:maltose alpha-D-glucosyltransferase/alpha-amylase
MVRGGRLLYRDSGEATARALGDVPAVHQLGVEQSNTSLRIDRTLACKLFRRLERGENPELEVGRFLAGTSFRAMPLLRGSITYVSARGEPATIGILQDWIESRGDGWSHVVGLIRQHGEHASEALREDVFALGATTARFHGALATGGEPAFAPEPATRADIDAWRGQLNERLTRTIDLVAAHAPSGPELSRALGETFVALGRQLAGVALPDPEQPLSRFDKIRVHGDYHLGQTLRTETGFVLIDFEGEPARPLAERRQCQPALKDVAGMLRSFDYAAEAALSESDVRREEGSIAPALRRHFLDGYRDALNQHPAEFVPASPGAADAWIDFFEIDKALYEVEYELNNRPAWVHIPLRGLVRIASANRAGR